MAERLSRLQTPVGVIACVVCLTSASALLSIETHSVLGLVPLVALAVPAIVYVALVIDPAITLIAGVFLSPVAGNWQQLGVPGAASPDRLLVATTIVVVVLRAVTGRGAPLPRPRPVHYVLALAVLYAIASALAARTLFQRQAFLEIVESYGALPFAIFYLAPVILRTPRHRRWMLATLVLLGAYLGLTVVFETVGPHALVWPRYILSPTYGIHQGRGRGPFADAVANGFGLYTCALASFVATVKWRGRARLTAGAVGLLCMVGTTPHPRAIHLDRSSRGQRHHAAQLPESVADRVTHRGRRRAHRSAGGPPHPGAPRESRPRGRARRARSGIVRTSPPLR